MKYFEKKISALLLAFAAVLTLMFGAFVPVSAEDLDDSTKEMIVSAAESLAPALAQLTDEELSQYAALGDAIALAWLEAKDDYSAIAEDQSGAGETVVSGSDNVYSVSVPVILEDQTVNFVLELDMTSGQWTGLTVEAPEEESLGATLKTAGLNTLMGLGTVFVMLIFLAFLISLFKYIGAPSKKEQEKAAAETAAPVVPAAVEEEEIDDLELIAVITAAIAASEGTGTDGFVVRSIRKARRSR